MFLRDEKRATKSLVFAFNSAGLNRGRYDWIFPGGSNYIKVFTMEGFIG